ncbi:hypothetical protein GCM10010094_36900 [Streptomyces flaveus]|uniref:Uncharacterized protein n=1 Tax=Streptomyces flaveus TaxID=66370 RepID=A0A917QWN7_9ACTN|nr:hypothetical protein GCM10010094_36900 [Streptomyces flaveus]
MPFIGHRSCDPRAFHRTSAWGGPAAQLFSDGCHALSFVECRRGGSNDPVVIMTTHPKCVNTGDTYTDTRVSTTVDTDGSASQSEGAGARHVHAMKEFSNAH